MEVNAYGPSAPPASSVWLAAFKSFWRWSSSAITARKPRRLRVCETLSLGERRFLAVVIFDGQEFLVGGTGNSLELLARMRDGKILPDSPSPMGPCSM